ncbi:NUDIX domain-containing protein [Paenibacillus sp. S28]|nr:NUDIX domain-containing protein [Paenibacillus sp. S28]
MSVSQTIRVEWGGQPVKLTWIPTKDMPDPAKVTSVHGICMLRGNVLAVHVDGRGFDIPGGHVEPGETPEEAFHREVLEEGSVRGRAVYIGMMEVSHEENEHFDPNGKYPLVGYQLFYRMDIEECLPFNRENECLARIWVEPEEFRYVIDHALLGLVLEEALKQPGESGGER